MIGEKKLVIFLLVLAICFNSLLEHPLMSVVSNDECRLLFLEYFFFDFESAVRGFPGSAA